MLYHNRDGVGQQAGSSAQVIIWRYQSHLHLFNMSIDRPPTYEAVSELQPVPQSDTDPPSRHNSDAEQQRPLPCNKHCAMCGKCLACICVCCCYGTMVASLATSGPVCFAIGPDPCILCSLAGL
jgi:hypothetical protein